MKEIRQRTKVVGAFQDGHSALMLCAARLRHIAETMWGSKRYLNMDLLKEQGLKLKQAAEEVNPDRALPKKAKDSLHYPSEVPVEDRSFVATHVAKFTFQFFRMVRFDGTIKITKTKKQRTNQQVTSNLKI